MTAAATRLRRLGRTDVEVSPLSIGTAALGGLYAHVDEHEAAAVVRRALSAGLRYLDTAPQYGHGTAERRVGAALAGVPRDAYALSTKVGRRIVERAGADTGIFADAPPSDAVFDFSRDGVLRSLEASLERLGLDRVDVVYLHDPDDHEAQARDEAYPALEELRAQGVVRAIGAGMNQTAMLERFVRETDVDVVLVAGRYTLLDRSAAAGLLPACAERGVAVVVGGVYNSGVLASGATYDYAPAEPALLARVARLAERCRAYDVPLKAAALQFPLRHPAVTCVLSGARSVAELDENIALLAHPVPDALWEEL